MPVKLTVWRLEPDGKVRVGGEEQVADPGVRWIDLESPDEPTLDRLQKALNLHRLAVEDALHFDQRPKLEEYPGHLFLVLQAFTRAGTDICDLQLHEVHFFIGKDWILTVHDNSHPAFAEVAKRVVEQPENTLARGPDFIAYQLADRMIDGHFPLLENVGDAMDEVEDRVFTEASRSQLERMFELRKLLAYLRRVLSPQRDVIGLLAHRGVMNVQDTTTLYFRDISDHLFRLYEQLDSARELLGSVKDAYLSMVAQRTNDVTKQLTLFASLFLPMTFIVGFFGQNFEQLNRPFLFWVMAASMIVVPAGTFVYFARRHWL
jgi:magnesium transporter